MINTFYTQKISFPSTNIKEGDLLATTYDKDGKIINVQIIRKNGLIESLNYELIEEK